MECVFFATVCGKTIDRSNTLPDGRCALAKWWQWLWVCGQPMRGWAGVVCMAVLTACANVPEENLQAYDWELVAARDRAGAVLTADEVPE